MAWALCHWLQQRSKSDRDWIFSAAFRRKARHPISPCLRRLKAGFPLKMRLPEEERAGFQSDRSSIRNLRRGSERLVAGRVHAEWLENALVQKLPVRFAARLFYDDAEQIITGVIVRPSLARLKLK